MFIRDSVCRPTNGLYSTGVTQSFDVTVEDGKLRFATLHFRARLFSDWIWRIHVYADYLPSVSYTGAGDPIDEYFNFYRGFIDYFATPEENRVLPWEGLN